MRANSTLPERARRKVIGDAERPDDPPGAAPVDAPQRVGIGGEHVACDIDRGGCDRHGVGRSQNGRGRHRETHQPPLQFFELSFDLPPIGNVPRHLRRANDGSRGSRIGETVREIGTSLPSLHFRIVSKCSMALATANVRKHHILFGKTIGRDRLAVSQARLIGVVRSCLVSHVISHHRRRARRWTATASPVKSPAAARLRSFRTRMRARPP